LLIHERDRGVTVHKGARKPQDGPSPHGSHEGPSTPANAPQGAPGGPEKATGEERKIRPNKPLGFSLTLDPDHPYLKERGLTPELIATFGLGYCGKGSMAGRVCIPIHDGDGALVAYAGRWVGPEEDLPEGKGKYELPAGFHKGLELFNLHRAKHCKHLVVLPPRGQAPQARASLLTSSRHARRELATLGPTSLRNVAEIGSPCR
jgi:hypothetical protein